MCGFGNTQSKIVTQHQHQQVDMLLAHLMPKDTDAPRKVVDFAPPDELREKVNLAIAADPQALEVFTPQHTFLFLRLHSTSPLPQDCLSSCSDVISYSVNSSHPFFFNQLFAKVDIVSLMGDWMTSALNVSMYTYEVAPVFTLMEEYILGKVASLLGFVEADGIFAPGGSSSNLYGLLAARHRRYPEMKEKGMFGVTRRPVVLCSAHSHYSSKKACIMMGLGLESCIAVPCDASGQMLVDTLASMIHEIDASTTQEVLAVVCTAGTTVYGAFDNVSAITSLCKPHNIWVHVDGAWGGSCILEETLKESLLKDINQADSFTWNPHKMMGIPLQCSCVLINHGRSFGKSGILQDALGTSAGYLFQPDKLYPVEYDTGDKSFQCGRKVDVFKLWISWKARGDNGMAQAVRDAFRFRDTLIDALKCDPSFDLVVDTPQFTNVCFYCVPQGLREEGAEQRTAILNKIPPLVKQYMQQEGSTLVGYQQLDGKPNFWRMVCISNSAGPEGASKLLALIKEYTERAYQTLIV